MTGFWLTKRIENRDHAMVQWPIEVSQLKNVESRIDRIFCF